MCGVVGFASKSSIVDTNTLIAMLNTLKHRGPDDSGIWLSCDGHLGFGHRRLSIIDLSPLGHQPMSDNNEQLCITYNGEIYNYKDLRKQLENHGHVFKTKTDTEVILKAYLQWGTNFLDHLNGMFAFGLYDNSSRILIMARDRAGEKPLYYFHHKDSLIFASELKALMANPSFDRCLDAEALQFYLAYGYVPGERCLLKGVNKLPPAHVLFFHLDTGSLKIIRYWRLPEPSLVSMVSEDQLFEELENILMDSVQRCLTTADVPVGILLSGGIDSSLITAFASNKGNIPVNTFTVSFPGENQYDEGSYAQLVASHFRTNHTQLEADPVSVELLPMLAKQYDEPIADPSIVPTYLVCKLIRQYAPVALGGDGGDELSGGYPHYNYIFYYKKIKEILPEMFRSLISIVGIHILPLGAKGRNHLIGFSGDFGNSLAHINMYFDDIARQKLLEPLGALSKEYLCPELYKARLVDSKLSPLQQATQLDFLTTMADAFLVKVDRASMLNSLEVRSPWLDRRIIEFYFKMVPDLLRATFKDRKILSKRLARSILPNQLDLERKQGFSIPLNNWFRNGWGNYMENILKEMDGKIFNHTMIMDMFTRQQRGYANENRLFALTMLELWRREYKIWNIR